MTTRQIDRIPFQFSEQNLSEQQFFGSILQGIASILPKALPFIGNLLGGGNAGRSKGDNTVDAITQLLNNKEVISALQKLISSASSTPQIATAKSVNGNYSEAKIAPLAALLPLLQNAISPDVMKSLINSPQKLLKTISDASFKITDRELTHLEKINPGVDGDNQLIQNILAAMTLSMASNTSAIKFTRINSVTLVCNRQLTELMGRQVNVFSKTTDLTLPLTVNTPKAIGKAMIQLIAKDADSMEVLLDKKIKATHIHNGMPLSEVRLTREELERMPENRDINLCISLVFKNKKGNNIGTHKILPIVLVSQYTVGRILPGSSEPIPLNDIVAHRDFWHKAWEDDFKGETRELNFQVKYYYRVSDEKPNNSQIETKLLTSDPKGMGHDREINYRLKSGFEAGLHTLNQILPQVSGHPVLNAQQLGALESDEFAKNFDASATALLKFRGKPGDMAALWVFPELEIKQIALKRATQTDRYGQVIQFEEEVIHFPVPKFIHFVGVRSER